MGHVGFKILNPYRVTTSNIECKTVAGFKIGVTAKTQVAVGFVAGRNSRNTRNKIRLNHDF